MSTVRAVVRCIALVLPILIVGGCGYQLRGAVSLPLDIDAIRVEGPPGIGPAIIELLDRRGIRGQSTHGSTKTLLHLGNEQFSRRVLSIDPMTGREREFELAYSVAFRVTGEDGEELVPEGTVSLLRDYVFDTDAVLAKDHEQNVLEAEMRRDAAREIVSRIVAALGH